MLHDGVLWLGLDGKLISVNYQSEIEKKKQKEIIQSGRKNLHSSLKVFETPVLHWETEKYRIRIDRLRDSKYRYAVWPVSKSQRDKPDLILNNGTKSFEGSGGNHSYHFTSGSYRYSCYVQILGLDYTPGWLIVYKNDEEILTEKVINVIKEDQERQISP